MDDTQYGDLYSPPSAPQAEAAPVAMAPEMDPGAAFSQSDALRLQRLQNATSTVQTQVEDGILSPEEGMQLKGKLSAMQGPLAERQAAAKKAAEAQAKMQLMDQTALQESVEGVHAKTRAGRFTDSVASFTDPISGETRHFYQPEPGKFEPIEFPDDDAPSEAPENYMLGAGLAVGANPSEGPPPLPEGDQPAIQSQAALQPSEDGHHMIIWNGAHRQEFLFPEGGGPGREIANNRPAPGGQGDPLDALSPAAKQFYFQQAANLVKMPPLPPGNSPQAMAHRSALQRQYFADLNKTARTFATQGSAQQRMQQQQAMRTQENQRREAAQAQEHRTQESAREHQKHAVDLYARFRELALKEHPSGSAKDIETAVEAMMQHHAKLTGTPASAAPGARPEVKDAVAEMLKGAQKRQEPSDPRPGFVSEVAVPNSPPGNGPDSLWRK